MPDSMTKVEYQLTEREIVFANLGRYLKKTRKEWAFILLNLLIAIPLLIIDSPFSFIGWIPLAIVAIPLLFLILYIIRLLYKNKENPTMLKTILAFGEPGIVAFVDEGRVELTWQALWSCSQSKSYIFLWVGKTTAMLIPKRAFTDEQRKEFLRLAQKIYAYQSPQARRQARESLEQSNTFVHKVFLSYAREDINIAMHLFNDLRKAGVDVWFDRKSLLPGQNWQTAIKQAIRERRFFLALLSSNSVSKKGYVQKELKQALDILDEYPESAIFLIPIRLDNCNPTNEKLRELHWIDIFNDWEDGVVQILNTIRSQDASRSSY